MASLFLSMLYAIYELSLMLINLIPKLFCASMCQEEDLYEIDVPLKFKAAVGGRVHGLACWFDVLFNGR